MTRDHIIIYIEGQCIFIFILCSLRHQILYILAIMMSFGMALEGRVLPHFKLNGGEVGARASGAPLLPPPTYIHNYYVYTCMYLSPSSTHDIIIMVQNLCLQSH